MEYKRKGIILSALSGTGKTTHAHLWRDGYHALILNGDRPLCGKKDGIWTGYGTPWCGSSGEYMNRDVPIYAFVIIQQSRKNELIRLRSVEAFKGMYENLQLPFTNKTLISAGLDLFDEMLSVIPVYLLKCRPEMEAAKLLKQEIDKL